jgi:hypothetical protein
VLAPAVNCSLAAEACIAPPGSSRVDHNFDQTAFSLLIWASGFSCLPRETHCMWSVKKTSRDALASSAPIEVVSRGHRLPKPYDSYIRKRPGCVPDKARAPWPAMAVQRAESNKRYSLAFRIVRIYVQPVGDFVVQFFSCGGAHGATLVGYWVLLACAAVLGARRAASWGDGSCGCCCCCCCIVLAQAWRRAGGAPSGSGSPLPSAGGAVFAGAPPTQGESTRSGGSRYQTLGGHGHGTCRRQPLVHVLAGTAALILVQLLGFCITRLVK